MSENQNRIFTWAESKPLIFENTNGPGFAAFLYTSPYILETSSLFTEFPMLPVNATLGIFLLVVSIVT